MLNYVCQAIKNPKPPNPLNLHAVLLVSLLPHLSFANIFSIAERTLPPSLLNITNIGLPLVANISSVTILTSCPLSLHVPPLQQQCMCLLCANQLLGCQNYKLFAIRDYSYPPVMTFRHARNHTPSTAHAHELLSFEATAKLFRKQLLETSNKQNHFSCSTSCTFNVPSGSAKTQPNPLIVCYLRGAKHENLIPLCCPSTDTPDPKEYRVFMFITPFALIAIRLPSLTPANHPPPPNLHSLSALPGNSICSSQDNSCANTEEPKFTVQRTRSLSPV